MSPPICISTYIYTEKYPGASSSCEELRGANPRDQGYLDPGAKNARFIRVMRKIFSCPQQDLPDEAQPPCKRVEALEVDSVTYGARRRATHQCSRSGHRDSPHPGTFREILRDGDRATKPTECALLHNKNNCHA